MKLGIENEYPSVSRKAHFAAVMAAMSEEDDHFTITTTCGRMSKAQHEAWLEEQKRENNERKN